MERQMADEAARQGSGPIKALLFDTFGTVVDWRGGVAREAAAFLARHGIEGDPAAFADSWRNFYQPAMEEIRNGRRSFTRLDVLHRENLERVLEAWNLEDRKSTRLNSSHVRISYAVFCLKKKNIRNQRDY